MLLATFVLVIEGLVALGCTVFAVDEGTLESEWLKVLGLSRWEHFYWFACCPLWLTGFLRSFENSSRTQLLMFLHVCFKQLKPMGE